MAQASGFVNQAMKLFGYMFYVADPWETSYEDVEDVPYFVTEVIPLFMLFIFAEKFVHLVRDSDRQSFSVNDDIGSVGQGIFLEITKVYLKGLDVVAYIWIYDNYRLFTLPWDSAYTWIIAFLCVDFLYYVVHRSSHEVNFMWAAHQVHHSSEYYNFGTALRQSIVHNFVSFYLYLPMALAVPPSTFLVHIQFNLIYQFWIHTEVIKNIGPLEYVLNTPSHHRVHHGRNRYCIDKNFGGTLIIWDRLLGTFESEDEKVVYGLVHPIESFNPLYLQFCHYIHIVKTFVATDGITNKLKVVFYGPGWSPGIPRTGLIDDIPDIHAPSEPYNPPLKLWCRYYVFLHFLVFTVGYVIMAMKIFPMSESGVFCICAFVLVSLMSMSFICDRKSFAAPVELSRCILYLALDGLVSARHHELPFIFIKALFFISAIIWAFQAAKPFTSSIKLKFQ